MFVLVRCLFRIFVKSVGMCWVRMIGVLILAGIVLMILCSVCGLFVEDLMVMICGVFLVLGVLFCVIGDWVIGVKVCLVGVFFLVVGVWKVCVVGWFG